MKRFLLTGLFLIGLGQMVSFAQNGTYKDDIYYKSTDIADDNKNEEQQAVRRYDDSSYYNSSEESSQDQGGYSTSERSYNTDQNYNSDDYVDYEDNNYYSTRISRFSYPFYNMGYYSTFYNPFWYDPFYFDSYSGWSYWNRPGLSMSFGFGPYWSSYWGYYSWYGYPAYYSYYNYPCYTGWYDGGYYSGYWNGYYAGVNDNSVHHNVVYGPRSSTNTAYNTGIRSNNVRQAVGLGGQVTGPRPPLRGIELNNPVAVRNPSVKEPVRSASASGSVSGRDRVIRFQNQDAMTNDGGRMERTEANPGDRPGRRQFTEQSDRAEESNSAIQEDRRQTDSRFEMPSRDQAQEQRPRQMQQDRPGRIEQQPRQSEVRSQPREREQPRYEQPRSESRSQPVQRIESPRMSPSAPSSTPRGGGRR